MSAARRETGGRLAGAEACDEAVELEDDDSDGAVDTAGKVAHNYANWSGENSGVAI